MKWIMESADAKLKYEIGTSLETQVESAISFINIEIPQIVKEKIIEWMNTESRLDRHRQRINRILRESPHVSDTETQTVIESMSRWPRMSGDAYDELIISDLNWTNIINNANDTIIADISAFRNVRRKINLDELQKVDSAFLNKLKSLENVFGLLYTYRIEAD